MNIGKFEELNNKEMMQVEGGFFFTLLVAILATTGLLAGTLISKFGK